MYTNKAFSPFTSTIYRQKQLKDDKTSKNCCEPCKARMILGTCELPSHSGLFNAEEAKSGSGWSRGQRIAEQTTACRWCGADNGEGWAIVEKSCSSENRLKCKTIWLRRSSSVTTLICLRGRNVLHFNLFPLLRDCSTIAQSYLCHSNEPLPTYDNGGVQGKHLGSQWSLWWKLCYCIVQKYRETWKIFSKLNEQQLKFPSTPKLTWLASPNFSSPLVVEWRTRSWD